MTLVQRLLPLALLSIASQYSYAAGNGSIEPYSATLAPRTATPASEHVSGLSYKSLYARYYRSYARNFFGVADARASGYLDVGVKHNIGNATTLNLHAGDGRVAGAGNGGLDWRDLKAGLSRKFEGGWAVSGTYSRAFGAAGGGTFDRYAGIMPRSELRPVPGSKTARGALVMTLSRRF